MKKLRYGPELTGGSLWIGDLILVGKQKVEPWIYKQDIIMQLNCLVMEDLLIIELKKRLDGGYIKIIWSARYEV